MIDKIFKDFLLSGILGPIYLNSEKNGVLGIFQQPDDVLINGDLELYKFKDLEITFQNNSVAIINLEIMGKEVSFPNEIPIDHLFSGYTLEEITSDLDDAEIGWHICTERSYDQDLALVTEAGVLIFYELPSAGLGKIQLSGLTPNYYHYAKE